ncbi:helix-turn-helix domain-containing protein [Palleronia aestuarii]|uniref:helix-turn-helix domain-containing protein n=1 Tax=Palleronia aestuarii TaxID=568105 RepID=UPI001B8844A3|nr:helix-turn-helix transcriptional regulator [Palleronia aestuarii]
MSTTHVFVQNLLQAMREEGMSEAELSRKAGMSRRGVTDLREGRAQSPKLSTVFALAEALGRDPGELMGLGKRPQVRADLADFLSQYDEADQERFLSALVAMSRHRA